MAQTTQITIDNQTFPSFRSKLNESLSALNTLNSGTSRPSSAAAGTIWLDTTNATNPTLKFYDGADDISLATIDYSANTVNWLDSSVNLVSPVTISGNDTAGAEIRLPEDTDNGSNYVGLKAADSIASNVTFTLPSTDGTDGQALKTDGSGNLSFGDAGRLGTVNWDTTAKTANFTAVSGVGYFVNTTSGAITVTTPASPSAGDIFSLADYAATWQTNNATVSPNGTDKIGGVNADAVLSTKGQSVTFVYVDSTQGWVNTMDSTSNVRGNAFIIATGGTITTCGDYKIHTFTSPGTFCVSGTAACASDNTVDYLVVAGGGGGKDNVGGGGGAGGFRESSGNTGCYTASPLATPTGITVTATGYPITVGGGGSVCSSGSNSVFSTITSAGGGGGASGNGVPGGSGSGASRGLCKPGGSGNTPPVSPPQGNNGGDGCPGPGAGGSGGGGGAIGSGANGLLDNNPGSGTGGAGAGTNINTATGEDGPGPLRYYAGGGGGAVRCGALSSIPGGVGGIGGGGDGGGGPVTSAGTAGTTNTGGGGGAGDNSPAGAGAAGGSGIVIIRYKYQ